MTTSVNSRKVTSSSGPGFERIDDTKEHDRFKDLLALVIGLDKKDSFEKLLFKSSKHNDNPSLGEKLGTKLRFAWFSLHSNIIFNSEPEYLSLFEFKFAINFVKLDKTRFLTFFNT